MRRPRKKRVCPPGAVTREFGLLQDLCTLYLAQKGSSSSDRASDLGTELCGGSPKRDSRTHL